MKNHTSRGMSSDALPQGRQMNRIDAQAVIQVGPEAALRDRRLEVMMGGGNHANIHTLRARGSHALEFPFLQNAEKLHLNLRRQVTDLVQEDRAAVGQLEAPLPHPHGAGERAFLMAEQLAFDERRRKRGAVDPHQRARMPPAPFVQRPGEQFLAGSGRAQQQHARVRWRDLSQPRQRESKRRTLADDVVEVVIALDLLFQIHVVRLEPGVQPLDHGDVGSKRVLVAPALQRGAQDL